jgi:hypothetical protein
LLRVSGVNPRYFTDDSGKAVPLAGSHTWANLQDIGYVDPPPTFGWVGFLEFLEAKGHNFFRMFSWEQSHYANDDAGAVVPPPHVYKRTGPGNANDGKLKFDLDQLDQDYFDRLRQRIIDAGNRDIYVSIMLFNGFSVGQKNGGDVSNPWLGHPFNASNNINGVNGDPGGDGNVLNLSGYEVEQGSVSAVQDYEEAYVQKVIDTVNDLYNVLYEVCNETMPNAASVAWQNDMIDLIHSYEATKDKQHPVGFTVPYPSGVDADLFASDAEWISPNNDTHDYKADPPAADGSKVVVSDTDHLWGIGGDRTWAWKNFCRGNNLLFMDPYDFFDPGNVDMTPAYVSVRDSLGWILWYGSRVDLIGMTPQNGGTSPCSTGYCLHKTGEYLCYQPGTGSFDVSLVGDIGTFDLEWLRCSDGTVQSGGTVSGDGIRTLTPPWSGDVVAYLKVQ